jgi:hypothetical protein
MGKQSKSSGYIGYNHSQLKDLRESYNQKILRKFRVSSIEDGKIFPPVGHILSVMVERLSILELNVEEFISKWNKYIWAEKEKRDYLKGVSDHLDMVSYVGLRRMFKDDFHIGKMSKKDYNFLVKEAVGGRNGFFREL